MNNQNVNNISGCARQTKPDINELFWKRH